jgi:hypothetical protein
LFTNCSEQKSRVLSFEYGIYDDTVNAVLEGEVYKVNPEKHSHDSLIPLPNVTVKAEDSTRSVYRTTITNKRGHFTLGLSPNSTYSLVVMKKGYQTARITNYFADTGQVSRVKIILEDPSFF